MKKYAAGVILIALTFALPLQSPERPAYAASFAQTQTPPPPPPPPSTAKPESDDGIPIANDALAASPQFKRLSAADKQLMYDSLLLSAAVIAIVHQSGDKAASQQIAKGVLQSLVGITN